MLNFLGAVRVEFRCLYLSSKRPSCWAASPAPGSCQQVMSPIDLIRTVLTLEGVLGINNEEGRVCIQGDPLPFWRLKGAWTCKAKLEPAKSLTCPKVTGK